MSGNPGRRGAFIQPEVELPPGFTLPSVALIPPAAGMTTMADVGVGFARLSAVLGPCAHPGAVPVDLLLTGETVAWLCPGCDVQLPPGWIGLR